MQGWLASLLGTSIGLLLVVGLGLLVLPDPPLVDIRPLVQRFVQPAAPATPVAAPPAPAPVAASLPVVRGRPDPAPAQRAQPAPPPPPPPIEALPGPSGLAGLLRPPPPGWSTGTGFFVNSRGTILTAEHVVRGCRGVRVMSGHIRPENATVVAMDTEHDVAVLEVPELSAPAWLPVGLPVRQVSHLFVLGFPQGSLPDVPNEAWAQLVNSAFPANAPIITDPRDLVWLRHQQLGPGYSGGPVIDPNTGRVVGMIRAGIESNRLATLHGVSTQHLALGPGTAPMLAMMSRWTVREGVVPATLSGEGAVDLARKATVRVVCTK